MTVGAPGSAASSRTPILVALVLRRRARGHRRAGTAGTRTTAADRIRVGTMAGENVLHDLGVVPRADAPADRVALSRLYYL
ncbi:hypothetical protein [Nocardioides sp. AN3]